MVALSICEGRAVSLLRIANFLLCLLINVKDISSFNLDSSVPIIKRSSNSQSYFGFSIAQHYISEGSPNGHV